MHLYCNHLALTESKVYSTKAVMHAVLTEKKANKVKDFLLKGHRRIQKNMEDFGETR